MKFLKLVMTFMFASAIFAQRFMQDANNSSPAVTIDLKEIIPCLTMADCVRANLTPAAEFCVWRPGDRETVKSGECSYTDAQGVIRNDYQRHQ